MIDYIRNIEKRYGLRVYGIYGRSHKKVLKRLKAEGKRHRFHGPAGGCFFHDDPIKPTGLPAILINPTYPSHTKKMILWHEVRHAYQNKRTRHTQEYDAELFTLRKALRSGDDRVIEDVVRNIDYWCRLDGRVKTLKPYKKAGFRLIKTKEYARAHRRIYGD